MLTKAAAIYTFSILCELLFMDLNPAPPGVLETTQPA